MGCIELSDGITNRQIPVKQLHGTVRIELSANGPRVILPDSVDVEWQESATTDTSLSRLFSA